MLKRVARLACVTLVNPLVSPLSNVDGTQVSRVHEFGALEALVVNPQNLWWLVVAKPKRGRIECWCAAAGALVGVK